MLYAGIDGGQSSTVAVVGDETRVLGRGAGPPADLVGEARDSQRQRAAIERALDDARTAAGLDATARFASLVAGISGFDEGLSVPPDLASQSDRTRIVHDTAIAHAGALGGESGIVVIAGTGSVALGNGVASDSFVRAGGWGYYFGDEGSAVWIARTAIRRAMECEDRGVPIDLGRRAMTFFGAISLRQIQHAFAHGELTRSALANFARDVLASALEDREAGDVCKLAASELARLCAIVDERLGDAPARRVSYAGGLFENPAFVRLFVAAVGDDARMSVCAPAFDPAVGALLLARGKNHARDTKQA